MGEISTSRRIYKLIAIVNFVLGISSFLATWIILKFPIGYSILIAIGVVVLLFFIADVASKFTLHSRYLLPIRKSLLYWLSCVAIEKWDVTVEIGEDGTALVTNEISGRVNFGFANWIKLGIWAGKKQPKGKNYKMNAFDVEKQVERDCEFIFNEDKHKLVRIRLGRTLERKDKFHLKVWYKMTETFYFDKEDYYSFEAVHHEKEINITVIFPPRTIIQYFGSQITTEHGDVWTEHEKPIQLNPQTITWKIGKALHGNSHKLYWKVRKEI